VDKKKENVPVGGVLKRQSIADSNSDSKSNDPNTLSKNAKRNRARRAKRKAKKGGDSPDIDDQQNQEGSA